VPDQTATGQARMQFEERANKRLDKHESILEAAGATVERRLVFTHDAQKTLDRMSDEAHCLAVLVPNETRPPDDVLVAVRGTAGVGRIAQVVAGLFSSTDVTVRCTTSARRTRQTTISRPSSTGCATGL